MKKIVFALLCLFGLITRAFSQAKLIEKIEKNGNDFIIPYEKYQLANGLTVVVHEDHSDPIVYVDVTYHVGSAREQEGRSGFAHFFEHMMFQGSRNVADEQHFKIVTECGGKLNGSTNIDRTNYFETLPSNQLEVALWLEADRMGFLLDSVTQQKFEIQRATVKNERGQNYDNRPYGLANEKIAEALYPTNHPYAWLTIGYIEDLNRVNVNDLKNFFLRWYGPNNAVLTVAGDVNTQEVVRLAEKYFGSIPRGPEVNPQKVDPISLSENRYISYEDNIRMPQLHIVYPTVSQYHPDAPALQVLSDILGNGNNSLFYQKFVKSEKAVFASVYHNDAELAGTFNFIIRAYPNTKLADMELLFNQTLKDFEQRGVKQSDIDKFLNQYEANLVEQLSSVQMKGALLASNQTFYNNPNNLINELESFRKVKPEDVVRVYNQYIKNKGAVVLSIYPKEKPDLKARPDNYTKPVRNISQEAAEYKNLSYNPPKDNFDRSKKPASGPSPVIKVPSYNTYRFANGINCITVQSNETPTVNFTIKFLGGHQYDPKNKEGLSYLTTTLWNESTTKSSSEELSEKLDMLGSSIDFFSTDEYMEVNVYSLTKNIDKTLAILEEELFNPKFSDREFELFKKQQLEAINNQSTQARAIADNVFRKILYGKDHVYGTNLLGTEKSVNNITLDDVKNFYKTYFSSYNAKLLYTGNLSQEELIKKLNFLASIPNKKIDAVQLPETPIIDKTKIYFVNKEKAPQSEIRIGYLCLPFDATGDFYKTQILNYPLAGAFNSRINLNLRENKGYTYGARGVVMGSKHKGPYYFAAGVKVDATDLSIIEFMKEIKQYADNGITHDELIFTKNSMGQSEALGYETAWQKLNFIGNILEYNLPGNFTDLQNKILNTISKEELNMLAKKQLPYNQMAMVVVGDKTKVYDKLLKLGYPIIELDANGEVVAN
jgi:zinc protease